MRTINRLIIIIVFAIFPSLVFSQNAVIIKDNAQIHAESNAESRVLSNLDKATLITTLEYENGWFKIDQGWIHITDIQRFSHPLESTHIDVEDIYVRRLLQKSPTELSSDQIAYLMLHERRKDEGLRKDIKVIKNIQVIFAVLTGVSVAASIIFLTSP